MIWGFPPIFGNIHMVNISLFTTGFRSMLGGDRRISEPSTVVHGVSASASYWRLGRLEVFLSANAGHAV